MRDRDRARFRIDGAGRVECAKPYDAANLAYRAQDYAKAAELYTAAIGAGAESEGIEPAYFFLANALDNLYDPSKKGEAANDALLKNALKYYRLAADRLTASGTAEYKKLARLCGPSRMFFHCCKRQDGKH